MTEPTNSLPHARGRLVVVLTIGLLVLLLAEWASSRLVSEPTSASDTVSQRAENVIILPKDPAALPPDDGKPEVWLLGNSHTYSLPGLKQGDPLRTDEDGILIDELAARVAADQPDVHADFYLLAYPNFLPFEMLTRVGHLLDHGFHPKIVFLGLTWRNIARDSRPRHEIYTAYRDAAFVGHLREMLEDPQVAGDQDILQEITAQQAQAHHDEEVERLKSDADRVDELLTGWIRGRSTLMGKSPELRAQIFRTLTDRVQRLWDDRTNVTYSYDLVAHDYDFNLKCLRAMLRLLRRNGAIVICYYAPERSDLPPVMDPRRQNEFIAAFDEESQKNGIVVLDARGLVPNEYWGWVGESPDRSHFTQPGHQRLADLLYGEAEKRSAWKELIAP